MARELWLLRHGDAEPHGARADFDRRLTAKGEAQARAAGAAFAALGLGFDAILSSPRVRGRDTARLACEAAGEGDPVEHDPLSGGFDLDDAMTLLAGFESEQRVLVVGHEPDFSQVVLDLTGARIDLKKGGLAAIRVEGTRGELIVLARPKELVAIGAT